MANLSSLKNAILAAAAMALTTSPLAVGTVGVQTVQKHEGKVNKTYLDPVGIPTVCYGHTDKLLRMGMSFTDRECDQLLLADMAVAQKAITSCTRAPINGNQRDALTAFVFNVGGSAYCKSTLAKRINQGNYVAAAKEFPKWVYASGNGAHRKLPGLVTRRQAEAQLFLSKAPWKPYAIKSVLKAGESGVK